MHSPPPWLLGGPTQLRHVAKGRGSPITPVLQGVLVHWGRVGDKCSISLCVVSLKIFNGRNRCSGRGEALAVRADGRFRHLGGRRTSRAARHSGIDSLCNKNSDLNFQKFLLENEVGDTYLSFLGFY